MNNTLKLGKLPVKQDKRTIKFKNILKTVALPEIPESFDEDNSLGITIVGSIYGNDTWGDCVIVGRANQTLRFESFEQGTIIPITTQECLNEYWSEQGVTVSKCALINWLRKVQRPDNGLVYLDSLKDWRTDGWNVGGKQYKIYAFASVNKEDQTEVKQALSILGGLQVGIQLTEGAMNQFNESRVWDVTKDDGKVLGGHAIYVLSYDKDGLTCITWGKRQKMTWNWWNTYVDECYAIVDNKDEWINNSKLDIELLNSYLKEITGGA